MSMSSNTATTWSASSFPGYPHSTTLMSINPTKSAELQSIITNAVSHLMNPNIGKPDFVSYSRALRGAEASMTIVQAQNVLATATDSSILSQATEAIYDSTINLLELQWNEDSYGIWRLVWAPNIIYFIIFASTFLYTAGMIYKSRFHWYNVSWTLGLLCETIGFIGRLMSLNDMTNNNYFLVQLICLTIAPALLMGGIYFLFAQLVVIHGRQYSLLKPLWYSYLFIGCDILSLVIQAGGGAQASIASNNYQNAKPGTYTMIAGIAFQVLSMSVFSVFWYTFLTKIFFKHNFDTDLEIKGGDDLPVESHGYDQSYKKASIKNFLKLLFNTKNANQYKKNHLEQFYNPKFAKIRVRKLYNYYAFVISLAVLCIYIRCIYRVVELAEGFSGYLITHEVYLMVLDAFMIAIAALLFVPFHPQLVIGDASQIRLQDIKSRNDVHDGEDDNENIQITSQDNLNETDNIELGEKGNDELEDYEQEHTASDSSDVLQVEQNDVFHN
ncbi:putative transporter or flippase transmembrane protein [Scheffersomyces coipomensis]|uniref:putative transporter or flippase transmembrane protein n=1 Tax=Scheffersomyces coipomensis TaxID=1788519 RepID=UPI00315CB92F